MNVKFSDLIGQMLVSVDVRDDNELVTLKTDTGNIYTMHHPQDCCESVSLHDVVGDIGDILFARITDAYESMSDKENPSASLPEFNDESYTWTFYRISTIKGTVVMRWYGSSNGYYGEEVDFNQIDGKSLMNGEAA